MTTILSFTVFGNPVPKARPRVTRGHTYTPKRTLDYEAKVAESASNCNDYRWWSQEGRFGLRCTLFMGTKRRTDIDNVLKSLMDGLNGTCWEDDWQVDSVSVTRKFDAENPRAEIEIWPL